MFLIDDILLAPLKGLTWIAKKCKEVAEQELYNEENIKEKLMELQIRFELDEIGEKEYEKQEEELLARLNTIRKAKAVKRK